MKWFKNSNGWVPWLVAGAAAVATMAVSSWYRYVREPASRAPQRRSGPPKPPEPAPPAEASAEKPARSEPESSDVDYESWTKAELYERAKAWDIHGRSTMNKAELIEALQNHQPEA